MADKSAHQHMNSQKTMEINPDNSIIKELKKKYDADKGDKTFGDILHLLYETGLLVSGFDLTEPDKYANRLNRMITMGLGLACDEEDEVEEVEEELCKPCCNSPGQCGEDACSEGISPSEEDDESEMDAVD
jgi:molecular chaperone HtpG